MGYGGNLKIVRVVDETTSKNAGDVVGFLVKNEDHYESFASTDGIAAASLNANNYVAKYAGGSTVDQTKLYGNSLKVSVSNRTEFGIRLLNDNFTIPAGETDGFTLGNDVPGPEAGDTTFFIQDVAGGTGSAVVNEDLLRVGSGSRTITGFTAGVSNLDVSFGTDGFPNGS